MPLTALASSALMYLILLVCFSLKPARETPRWNWVELAVSTILYAIIFGVVTLFFPLGKSSFGSAPAYVASYTAMFFFAKISAYHVQTRRHKAWETKRAAAFAASVPPPPLVPSAVQSVLNLNNTWQQPPPENTLAETPLDPPPGEVPSDLR